MLWISQEYYQKSIITTSPGGSYHPKEVFRLAGLEGLIPDAEVWFEFAKKRNKTSHTYDGEIAEEILLTLPDFLRELDLLISKLKELSECSN